MKNRILRRVFDTDSNFDEEFISSVERQINNGISNSQLPLRFLQEHIDLNNAPSEFMKLGNRIVDMVDQRDSMLILIDSFKESGFISSSFIEHYITQSILKDKHMNRILYIDTNLLLEDYKKLITINESNEISPQLVYSKEILYKLIFESEYVIWDRFNLVSSEYENSKLYEILSVRYRNCLGNIYFVGGEDWSNACSTLGKDLFDVLGVTDSMDLSNLKFTHIK